MKMNIIFRDRTLTKTEMQHYYCEKCGAEIHYDLAHNHRCRTYLIDREDKLNLLLLKSKWRVV